MAVVSHNELCCHPPRVHAWMMYSIDSIQISRMHAACSHVGRPCWSMTQLHFKSSDLSQMLSMYLYIYIYQYLKLFMYIYVYIYKYMYIDKYQNSVWWKMTSCPARRAEVIPKGWLQTGPMMKPIGNVYFTSKLFTIRAWFAISFHFLGRAAAVAGLLTK